MQRKHRSQQRQEQFFSQQPLSPSPNHTNNNHLFTKKDSSKIFSSSNGSVRSFESSQLILSNEEMEAELKRKMVYATESYKEDPLNESTIQMNNKLFEMVFLGKCDRFGDSISTTASTTKRGMSISDFAVGKKLGTGKFGEVYAARHKKTGFFCAIKRMEKRDMDPKMIVQLVREIKIQSFLHHPNIVKLYAFFNDQSYIYLVEQLCYSGQLYSYLRKKKKIPQQQTKNIIQQVCRALDYMHECEIIHRDLKPQNIIYHNGLVKICDFGWSISSQQPRKTFCGTPLYISPQLLEQKHYSNKIDVWSVGILTYELLFGKVPFDINTKRDFIKIVLHML